MATVAGAARYAGYSIRSALVVLLSWYHCAGQTSACGGGYVKLPDAQFTASKPVGGPWSLVPESVNLASAFRTLLVATGAT